MTETRSDVGLRAYVKELQEQIIVLSDRAASRALEAAQVREDKAKLEGRVRSLEQELATAKEEAATAEEQLADLKGQHNRGAQT